MQAPLRRVAAALAALATATASTSALAAEVLVATSAELASALANAKAGDVVVLADGVYASAGASCAAMGSADAPIVVRAQNALGARIELDAVEGFLVSGAHWHFEDLEVVGTCPSGASCEHAFHVVGKAEGFVLRRSRVLDFHAQLKVNSTPNGAGGWDTPHAGLVEDCELADTAPRATSSPVTKLNIDTGDDWVVRGNYLHDFHKNGGNGVSYGAFMKSGGKRGLFERNLVVCSEVVNTGGVRIGLSFGGGGTAPEFCAPAFDPAVACDPEHSDGVMRNNVIASCSDVGIYLNRAATTRVVHNTLIETTGVDFRFPSTSGEAVGNLTSSQIRVRDGASLIEEQNVEDVPLADFEGWFSDPSVGELSLVPGADLSALVGAVTATDDVVFDLCLRERGGSPHDLGALEVSLGDCDTKPPPRAATGGAGGQGAGAGGGAGGAASGGTGGTSGGGGGPGGAGDGGQGGTGDPQPGCGCAVIGSAGGAATAQGRWQAWVALLVPLLAARRATRAPRRSARRAAG